MTATWTAVAEAPLATASDDDDTQDQAARTAEHAELLRAVVLARLLDRVGDLDARPGHEWLRLYEAELDAPRSGSGDETGGGRESWWSAALDAFELGLTVRTPWSSFDRTEALLVSAAGLVEDDLRFGTLFAALQAPVRARRPCLGLLRWLVGDLEDRAMALSCQRLVLRGVLDVVNPEDPRAEWVLALPAAVWELVQTGRVSAGSLPPGLALQPRAAFPAVAEVRVGDDLVEEVQTLPALVASGAFTALLVRGAQHSGRRTLLGAVARELGQDLLVCDDGRATAVGWRCFAALGALGPFLPVVRCRAGYADPTTLPELAGLDRTVAITAGPVGAIAGPPLAVPCTLTLTPCTASAREGLWRQAGLRPGLDALEEIVPRFLLTPGHLLAAAAVSLSRDADRTGVGIDAVRAAVATLQEAQLEPLATRLEPLWQPIPVLGRAATEELATLLLRCRHREQLAESGVTGDRGVRALLAGPSGTGKTLAARFLAGQLGLDLYRVSLAGIVNKYIGETEKNLDRLFSVAEELGVILLLDEGDSLMARRTDVGDANDRYANLETNFLLQRLEGFQGIVLVTSNAAARIDQAFLRRIDISIDFVPPDAEQRWQILSTHLTADHEVSADLLVEIARRCPLTGGVLRNAGLHAALLALDDGRPVDDGHLLAAVRREYRKLGAGCPLDAPGVLDPPDQRRRSR